LTPADYWQLIDRFHANTLSLQEQCYYRLAGVLAETQAREQGTSLLPFPWQNLHVPPTQLNSEILIAVGLTALVLQPKEDHSDVDSSNES